MRTRRFCEGSGYASVIEVIESASAGTYRAVYTARFPENVFVLHVFQKKSKSGSATPKADMDVIPRATADGRTADQERQAMKRSSKRKALPSHEPGSGNVYADLGSGDPEGMLVKAQLVAKIAEILGEQGYTQTKAADILGVPQPELSKILRGQFRGVSERKPLTP